MFLHHLRNRHFLVLDLVLLAVVPTLALALRVEPSSLARFAQGAMIFTVLALLVKLPVFYFFGLYRRYWLYASVDEMITIALAAAVTTMIIAGAFFGGQLTGLVESNALPRSIPLVDGLLTLLVVGGTRFSVRAAHHRRTKRTRGPDTKRVLIVGAGEAGTTIARQIGSNKAIKLEPIGFVDDDREKRGLRIHDVPVLGSRDEIPALVQTYDIQEVIIAMPSAPGKVIRDVVRMCEAAGVPFRTLPAIDDLLSGQVSVSRLRSVDIEDLLRREPVEIDMQAVGDMIAGRRVLVTGAGGSIGSELCRQIIRWEPAQLIVLGHGENSLFVLSNELSHQKAALCCQVVVADVRDRSRLESVFQRCRPQIVFHAAAHKHVPLMEDNIEDAVTNNVLGTRNVVELSEAYDVDRFVSISSDKAVNPVSVMGVTKRAAELVVSEVAGRAGRPYVSVRFGNVLGSRGSVVPLFRQQIANGGPVTVTHPDMTRYFMTIPEAVQLVLQAAALSQGSQVFVLDMGQPIKIVDLARDLIELSGYQVGRDIDIVFTGLRPGEKLFEELFLESEAYQRSPHARIFIARNGHHPAPALPNGGPAATLEQQIDALIEAARRGDADEVRRRLKVLVPEYNPPGAPSPADAERAAPAPPDPATAIIPPAGEVVEATKFSA